MGLFNTVFEIAKAVGELGKDLTNLTKESGKEFGEIMTDGFKEMVIKGNNDYKTSYEKIEMANSIVSSAKSTYKRAYEITESDYSQTKEELNAHINYKKKLYKDILTKNQNVVDKLLEINLDEYTVKKPIFNIEVDYINDYKKSAIGIMSFNNKPISQFSAYMGLNAISEFKTGWLSSQRQRVEAAEDDLEDAKDFRAKMNFEVERLNKIKSKLKLIREKIKEERALLDRLTQKLEYITLFLNKVNQRIAEFKTEYENKNYISKGIYKIQTHLENKPDEMLLTQEEKEKVLANIEISKMLNKVINTQFITDDFDITNEYNSMLQEMKDLEHQIKERGI